MPRKKGDVAGPKQRAAGVANLAKGREAKQKRREEAKKSHELLGAPRWAALLDGTLSVRDLDDQEIHKMRVRDADGGFNGPGRALPSHLAQQFQSEAIRRATELFRVYAPLAVKRLLEIADDDDVKPADQIRAIQIALERGLGRVPETIRVESASTFDQVGLEAIVLDRDLAGGSEAAE